MAKGSSKGFFTKAERQVAFSSQKQRLRKVEVLLSSKDLVHLQNMWKNFSLEFPSSNGIWSNFEYKQNWLNFEHKINSTLNAYKINSTSNTKSTVEAISVPIIEKICEFSKSGHYISFCDMQLLYLRKKWTKLFWKENFVEYNKIFSNKKKIPNFAILLLTVILLVPKFIIFSKIAQVWKN